MTVGPVTQEGWEIFRKNWVESKYIEEEIFLGVKALWEAVSSDPEAQLLVSNLHELAVDGMFYQELVKSISEDSNLMKLSGDANLEKQEGLLDST